MAPIGACTKGNILNLDSLIFPSSQKAWVEAEAPRSAVLAYLSRRKLNSLVLPELVSSQTRLH